MTDYGIKIAKPGFDVNDPITEATKKNFIILNTTDAHKIIYAGFVTSGSYTHSLSYVPLFECFAVDSTSSPTEFTSNADARATTTQITNIPNPGYIIIYHEGNE